MVTPRRRTRNMVLVTIFFIDQRHIPLEMQSASRRPHLLSRLLWYPFEHGSTQESSNQKKFAPIRIRTHDLMMAGVCTNHYATSLSKREEIAVNLQVDFNCIQEFSSWNEYRCDANEDWNHMVDRFIKIVIQ
jgi:hypothetical protein